MDAKIITLLMAGVTLGVWFVRSGEVAKPARAPAKEKLAISIQPKHVTDALRAVILSDREMYMQVAAEHQLRLAGTGNGTSLTQTVANLPSPCEMLRRGSQAAASKGVEYSYVLRSFQPINKRNAPETEVERKGLQFVSTRPDLTYSTEELLGGRWYFTAVYPDVAIHQSCISCHNLQKSGGRTDFKVGDVLGGLVVRIALEL